MSGSRGRAEAFALRSGCSRERRTHLLSRLLALLGGRNQPVRHAGGGGAQRLLLRGGLGRGLRGVPRARHRAQPRVLLHQQSNLLGQQRVVVILLAGVLGGGAGGELAVSHIVLLYDTRQVLPVVPPGHLPHEHGGRMERGAVRAILEFARTSHVDRSHRRGLHARC